ncbi:MAG: YdcF family protein [Lachnospiraceae bacterium]|nr:YdcF family protein [Lachnospiraceae bacterium]
MNIILFIIGLVGDIWCIAPIFIFRIFNIGNQTGILVFTAIMLIGLFWKRIRLLIGKWSKKKFVRCILTVVYSLIAVTVLLVIAETSCMIAANTASPSGNETLVVLGSRVFSYGPSKMTAARLDAAYDYMQEHPDSVCVLSGGQGSDEPWSEAKGMCDYLTAKGISKDRLFLEEHSTNTKENLAYSMEIIEAHNLNPEIAIVSNEFHLYRAGLVAKEAGISFKTIPAPSMLLLLPTYYIRELYAILAQWIF